MEYTIRKARMEDVEGIASILRELGWFVHIVEENEEATNQRILQHMQMCMADNSHSVYVACQKNGNIAGYISVHWLPYFILKAPEGYISELFIRQSERGKGLGVNLLDIVKEEAIQRGVCRLSLLNNRTRESYVRGFYTKCGWKEREVMANFIYFLVE
jgi:N-acetylglutamate synthase-like GNAT family acetyltransferase